MNWYKFNIPEFYEKTGNLSVHQELTYRKLIDLYYLNESPLPNDMEELVDAMDMGDEDTTLSVLLEFFVLNKEDDCWHDEAIDRDLMNRKHQVSINRKIGQKGGRPKSTKS
jgi:uncharacterized protein YdaU (DUF1376 family)